MKKINSYDKTMTHFLVTPEEMALLSESVFLELEYERILKRAWFSEKIFGQYCVRADLAFLDKFLKYVEQMRCQFRSRKRGQEAERLARRIRDAFFNPEVQRKEEAAAVVASAREAIASDELSRDPAYQELLEKIEPLAELIAKSGLETRLDYLRCYHCGAREDDTEDDHRVLLDRENLPAGHEKMVILAEHEEPYGEPEVTGYITTYNFMCPACGMVQTSVFSR